MVTRPCGKQISYPNLKGMVIASPKSSDFIVTPALDGFA